MLVEQLIVLALVQGLTEFLPISSSGHLVLIPHLFGWEDQGLAYDVAAHAGSLLAVVIYFFRDLRALAMAAVYSVTRGVVDDNARLAWLIVIATVPVCVVGYLGSDIIEASLRSPKVIAWATIVFGLILGLSDYLGTKRREEAELSVRDALVVGVAQCLALIPGTSRSGITMTAGLALGFDRRVASRFSFLLAVPVIFLASVLKAVELAGTQLPIDWGALAIVFTLSALSALVCIWWFLALIRRIGMLPFVVYRLLLGGTLLAIF